MSQYRRRLMMMVGTGGPTPPPSPLPAGAIPCDILYTDGYDAFIPTSFVPLQTMSYEAEMFLVLPSSALIAPFGYTINNARYRPVSFENRRLQVSYNGWYWGANNTYPYCIRLKMRAVVTPTGTTINYYLPDGTLYDTQTVTYSESAYVPNEAISLLGYRTSANGIYNGSWRGGLGALKCYGDDLFGTLVAEFNPCYYQGNFGFWDVAAQQFHTGNTPGAIYGFGQYWDTDGFAPNTLNDPAHNTPGYWYDDRGYITTREFQVTAGNQVQFNVGPSTLSTSIAALMCLNSNRSYVDWFTYNAVDRIITLPANTAYIRMSIPKANFGTAYLKDYTNGIYLWKGQNV